MGIEDIRRMKDAAKEPKVKKHYSIPKVSEKRKKQIEADKQTFEKDKEFYKEIWLASPHSCQCGCSRRLGKEPMTTFFHHLLFKAKYPQFRHTPENIMILHPECHNAYHAMSDSRPEIVRRAKEAEKLLLQ
jgi:5-methylcytosine-specific restriction endonuclease McrA